jgi:hypothetical protein
MRDVACVHTNVHALIHTRVHIKKTKSETKIMQVVIGYEVGDYGFLEAVDKFKESFVVKTAVGLCHMLLVTSDGNVYSIGQVLVCGFVWLVWGLGFRLCGFRLVVCGFVWLV